MNRLLESHALLLARTFNDFGSFELSKEVAKKVVEENPALKPEDLGKTENLSLMLNASMEIFPTVPVFERREKELVLKSKRFFEIIRCSLAVSSFVKGVDQFAAGYKLAEKKQRQFTVFVYYSSIFHFLTSFLALHGTVYIPKSTEGVTLQDVASIRKEDTTSGQITKISPIGFDKFRKGIFLHEKSEWSFSEIGNDHNTRWKEFCDLLKKYIRNNWENQIPKEVVRFWGYMKCLNEYKEKRWEKKSYSIEFSNKDEFLNALNTCRLLPAEIRHKKVYEDEHFDFFALGYVLNNKNPPEEILDAEEQLFQRCAEGMLMWQYYNLKELFAIVRGKCIKEPYFARGMNAIAANPFVKMLNYLISSFVDDKKLI